MKKKKFLQFKKNKRKIKILKKIFRKIFIIFYLNK
jgi:hypothetical protein